MGIPATMAMVARCCVTAAVGAVIWSGALSAGHAQQRPAPQMPPPAPSDNARAAAGSGPVAQQQSVPPLTFSRWTKLCERSAATKSRLICRTGRDGRLDNGVPLIAAVLIEVEGEPKKVLQVTLPVGVMLPRGTRVVIDDDEYAAVVAPFMVCTNAGCIAQLESDANAVARMKKGKSLHLQAFSMQQSVMTLTVPLAEFAQAYDGPPADQKQVDEQNQKLIEELQKKQAASSPAGNKR